MTFVGDTESVLAACQQPLPRLLANIIIIVIKANITDRITQDITVTITQ